MLFGIDKDAILQHRDALLNVAAKCGIVHFTSKESSHFVKTDFD